MIWDLSEKEHCHACEGMLKKKDPPCSGGCIDGEKTCCADED